MEKLERVQYQAALAVTGEWHSSNCAKLNEELGWGTLSDRCLCRRVLQIHKIMNNKTSSYLKDKLPPKHRPFLVNVFRRIKCRTDRYMNSFLPPAITSWNIFIPHFDDFPSVDSIFSLLRPKNKCFFRIHDPLCIRYLFQSRLCLSPFRSHKFHHNFIDTPSDICYCNQNIEDTRHFLFSVLFMLLKEQIC